MSQYILDTDCVTLFQHFHPEIAKRAKAIGHSNIFITTVTLQEQLQGRLAVMNKANAKHPDRLAIAHRNLQATLIYYCNVNLLPFDDAAYFHYQNLRQQKIRIGTNDLIIAAIALTHQAILVTKNQKDFNKVPDLSIEDWTLA
ncbi:MULTISPECIES: type II toxin-antitoxin system VapC family toxin [Spirulina sp. CCY15215]|uniref:type II toxin-antitoxin system VapC family toxin n=1 Tax=Spirulina sp. CCY15215 TaxID=2767591 RepID=UPI00194DC39C